jgi:hypothetical protein
MDQFFELGAIEEPVLQGAQFTNETRVPAMSDRAEVLGIELREKRITVVQTWIMYAEMRFENATAVADRFKPLARRPASTVVSSQVA